MAARETPRSSSPESSIRMNNISNTSSEQTTLPHSVYVHDAEYFAQHRKYNKATAEYEIESEIEAPEHGIVRIQTVGGDGFCGCPCYNSTDQHLEYEDEVVPALRDIYSKSEWSRLCTRIREILHDNAWPVCPFISLCCCWPLGVFQSVKNRRVELDELITEENQRLHPLGLEWKLSLGLIEEPFPCGRTLTPEMRVSLTMTWLPDIRRRYESLHPKVRKISEEPYPLQLLSHKQREERIKTAADEKAAKAKKQIDQLHYVATVLVKRQSLGVDVRAPSLPPALALGHSNNTPSTKLIGSTFTPHTRPTPGSSPSPGPPDQLMHDQSPTKQHTNSSTTTAEYPIHVPIQPPAVVAIRHERVFSFEFALPPPLPSNLENELIQLSELPPLSPPQQQPPRKFSRPRPIIEHRISPHLAHPLPSSSITAAQRSPSVCSYCGSLSRADYCLACGEPFQDARGEQAIRTP